MERAGNDVTFLDLVYRKLAVVSCDGFVVTSELVPY